MKEWEYKVLGFDGFMSASDESDIQKLLNEHGKEGWELVNVIPQVSSTGSVYGTEDVNISGAVRVFVQTNVFIFKRQRQ